MAIHTRRGTASCRNNLEKIAANNGAVLTMKAQAREDGAVGDTIALQRLGERTTFLGTVTRRGEAVVQYTRPGA